MILRKEDYKSPVVEIYEMDVEGCIAASGEVENSLSTDGYWDEE